MFIYEITVQIISVGVTSTTALVLLLVVLTFVIAILVVKRTNTHTERNEHTNEPIYEEIHTLDELKEGPVNCTNITAIELERNCSYGDINTIKLTESPAYNMVKQKNVHSRHQ